MHFEISVNFKMILFCQITPTAELRSIIVELGESMRGLHKIQRINGTLKYYFNIIKKILIIFIFYIYIKAGAF